MALEKTITLRNGTTGNYLRVDHVRFSWNERKALIWVSLFKDKEQADAEPNFPLQPIAVRVVVEEPAFSPLFSRAVLGAPGVSLLAQVYAAVKNADAAAREFKQATADAEAKKIEEANQDNADAKVITEPITPPTPPPNPIFAVFDLADAKDV